MDIYEIKFNNGVDYNAYDIERALRKVYKNAPRLSVVPASLALPKVDREKLAEAIKLTDAWICIKNYSEQIKVNPEETLNNLITVTITYLEGRV